MPDAYLSLNNLTKPDTTFKMARLRTNSFGMPKREREPLKPAGEMRIALVGISYSMPRGMPIEGSGYDAR